MDGSSEVVGSVTSETIALLQNRVSVRDYTDKPVSEQAIEAVLSAAFRAPTSSNIQAYSVIAVRDPEIKQQISVITNNQKHILTTSVFLAFCADLTNISDALKQRGHAIDDNNLEIGLVSSIDASLVGMSAYLAAESIGLKGVMIGAVRNDPVATAKALVLPRHVYCVFGMCLGWPADVPPQKPRMDYSRMVHYESYGQRRDDRDDVAAAADYDSALAAHYSEIGKPTTADSWSHDIDRKFNPQQRQALREQLAERGFDFR
jgi:nitroreductase